MRPEHSSPSPLSAQRPAATGDVAFGCVGANEFVLAPQTQTFYERIQDPVNSFGAEWLTKHDSDEGGLTAEATILKTLTHMALLSAAAVCSFVATGRRSREVAVSIGEPARLSLRLLRSASLQLRAGWLLWPGMVLRWLFHRGGAVVSRAGAFYGHVDHHFDYRKGYHGVMPARGEHPAEHRLEFTAMLRTIRVDTRLPRDTGKNSHTRA